jgi:hypothetical protein
MTVYLLDCAFSAPAKIFSDFFQIFLRDKRFVFVHSLCDQSEHSKATTKMKFSCDKCHENKVMKAFLFATRIRDLLFTTPITRSEIFQ